MDGFAYPSPISTNQWTHINTSLYHTYREESLFLSYVHYLYSTDQIHNPDKIPTSLLIDLTSTRKGPVTGGPTTSDVCLQQQAPFCFSRQNSMSNSYPQLGTVPPYLAPDTSGPRYLTLDISIAPIRPFLSH